MKLEVIAEAYSIVMITLGRDKLFQLQINNQNPTSEHRTQNQGAQVPKFMIKELNRSKTWYDIWFHIVRNSILRETLPSQV